ncbi:MAG: protein-glutamate O-methyltransferase CheR [Planctomycetota bacterium]
MSGSGKVTMTDGQFEDLRKIVYDRAGIHFPPNKKYILESRLCHRLRELELEDFGQYVSFLTMGPYQSDEFQEMFNRITINETSFFRHEAQLGVFEKVALPEILEARKTTKRLRLWSSASSSGEEPFTLAMQVHRSLGAQLSDWKVEILGTDISERALKIAQSGRYTDYAMRSTPDLVKSRYFKQDGREWVLNDDIRNMVTFELHNLKETVAARRFGTFDVIFCRNVMIYFDTEMKSRVLKGFSGQLAKDGTLFIGHSETVRPEEAPFQQLDIPHGFCYRLASSTSKLAA